MLSESSLFMLDKNTRRNTALDENSGQNEFENYLEKIPKNTREISITVPLIGNINLSFLEQNGFSKVIHILFREGSITNLINIPDTIEIIHCEDNLIQEMKDTPSSLREIYISKNMITSIDVSKSPSLENLQISYNDLEVLDNLPESLKSLKCDHNNLHKIEMNNLVNLQSLNCEENPKLILEKIPESVIQGNYPQVLRQNIKKLKETISEDYEISLMTYFK